MTQPPPIRRQVVANGPAEAFEVFTDEIGDWWPLGDFSVYGKDSTVALRDGRVVEGTSRSSRDCVSGASWWRPAHSTGRPTA
jgi:hypothetical protein